MGGGALVHPNRASATQGDVEACAAEAATAQRTLEVLREECAAAAEAARRLEVAAATEVEAAAAEAARRLEVAAATEVEARAAAEAAQEATRRCQQECTTLQEVSVG